MSETKHLDKKAIIFTDFDGTVTLQDSNDYLTDTIGFGGDKRRELSARILAGEMSFREAFSQMLESIPAPFDECIDILLANVKLDPGFKETYEWAVSEGVPIIVVSSGMRPIIKALLEKLLGEHDIEIISNDVEVNDADKTWRIKYIDDTPFGHDKSRAIKPFRHAKSDQIFFYCGDGVSDLSAAKETDLLFAKRGKDLVTYCRREKVPFKQFDSFKDILRDIKLVLNNEKTVAELDENNH